MSSSHALWRVTANGLVMVSLAVAGLGGAAAGCGAGEVPGEESAAGEVAGVTTAEGALGGEPVDPVAAACVGDRWIGKAPDGNCPAPGLGWNVSKLFDPPPAGDTLLVQYCLYEWKNDATTPIPGRLPELPGDPATPAEEWLDIDCAAVGAMGAGKSQQNVDLVAPDLWSAFLTQIDAPSGISAPAAAPNVEIAVIDSWPSRNEVGTSPHGFGMAGIIDGLTCGLLAGNQCAIDTTPRLALNLLEPRVRDNDEGGYFGHFGRLARQIYRASRTWKETAGPSDRLILNLSLGWEDTFNQENNGIPSLAVQAVHDAISWSVCQGALAIAAAGNTGGETSVPGQVGIGPTYPAAWQAEAAPSCVSCGAAGTCPLVYSVSGVDGRDLALSNVRPGARPPLAAPAFAVPGTRDVNGVPETAGPFTGSSVSAAAVSAAAAMVWTFDSNLTAAQVMARLYGTGVDLGVGSDFCVLSSCPDVHRISLCKALQASGLGQLPCSPPPAFQGQNPSVPAADRPIIAALPATQNRFDGTSLTGAVMACGEPVFVEAGTNDVQAEPACPLEALPTDVRNVAIDPQPGPDPCPACHAWASPVDTIILELMISERTANGVYAQVLTLLDGYGLVVARYDLASATGGILMTAGEAYQVTLPANGLHYNVEWRTALVEWLDPTERTAKTSQLIVTVQ